DHKSDASGVSLKVLEQAIDTSTPTGRLMFNMLGAIAQFERELMLERQREGVAKAKAEGKYKGRAPTARAKAAEVRRLCGEGVGATEIARRLGIGRASVYRVLGARLAGFTSHRRRPHVSNCQQIVYPQSGHRLKWLAPLRRGVPYLSEGDILR